MGTNPFGVPEGKLPASLDRPWLRWAAMLAGTRADAWRRHIGRRAYGRLAASDGAGWIDGVRRAVAPAHCGRASTTGTARCIDRLSDGLDFLRGVVGDGDVELFFQLHHQLDRVEEVRAQVVDKRGFGRDLFLVDAQLLGNDIDHSFLN